MEPRSGANALDCYTGQRGIYDSFARPQLSDTAQSHLLLIQELNQIDSQLLRVSQLNKHAFDSGEFWRTDLGRRVDRRQAVDAALMTDLTTAEKLLTEYTGCQPKRPMLS
jgi:hypothetical protein